MPAAGELMKPPFESWVRGIAFRVGRRGICRITQRIKVPTDIVLDRDRLAVHSLRRTALLSVRPNFALGLCDAGACLV